jgi:hypothetical protein
VLLAALVALVVSVGVPAPAHADTTPELVRSNFENYFGAKLVRDCGYSQPVPGSPGQSYWLFCDTLIFNLYGQGVGSVEGTTAARGPYTVGAAPTALAEMPSPPGPLPPAGSVAGPALMLGTPTGLKKVDGTTCVPRRDANGNRLDPWYPARWATGMTTIPNTSPGRFLITFEDVCVESPEVMPVHRSGFAEYTPSSNTLSPATVLWENLDAELDVRYQLGTPVYRNDFLFLFGSDCDGGMASGACTSGKVYETVVLPGAKANPAAYRWRRGTGPSWGDPGDVGDAGSILPASAKAMDVSVADFSAANRGLVIVETTSMGGHYRLWTATGGSATFTQLGVDRWTGDWCTTPGQPQYCRALIGHPEFSTTGQLALSFNAGKQQPPNPSIPLAAQEHVRMMMVDW